MVPQESDSGTCFFSNLSHLSRKITGFKKKCNSLFLNFQIIVYDESWLSLTCQFLINMQNRFLSKIYIVFTTMNNKNLDVKGKLPRALFV